MSFWKKLFGRKDESEGTSVEDLLSMLKEASDSDADGSEIPDNWHGLIVEFDYGTTDLGPMHALEDRLTDAIKAADVGEFDGHEIALDGSDGYFYMYGPDADRLADVVLPLLRENDFCKGARVTLRYGSVFDDDAQEKEITLES